MFPLQFFPCVYTCSYSVVAEGGDGDDVEGDDGGDDDRPYY